MTTAILWFRRDLRLDDNPALLRACAASERLLPLYIYAPDEEAPRAPGAASRWWLHHSLSALDASLRARGSRLWICRGPDSLEMLRRIAALTGAGAVYWNRLYEPAIRERDSRIKQTLRADGLQCESSNSALLFEPWEIGPEGGLRVFGAFWRRAFERLDTVAPAPAPVTLPAPPDDSVERLVDDDCLLDTLALLPRPDWAGGLRACWAPGEAGARQQAEHFVGRRLAGYAEARDIPGQPGVSALSAHLHFGELGPRRLCALVAASSAAQSPGAECYLRELGWREFAHHLLYHAPHTIAAPLDARFADFPWDTSAGAADRLVAWQRGRTGIPLVDAGMRELWHTGWMHNRVRMVAASFLTKNLLIPWQAGARWFWDTLVDANLAANTLGWQWVAGCGADAAPYFRVFNPVLQGQRFDPQGHYIRRWCPELARLPDKFVHAPATAPAEVLAAAGVVLGETYPRPLVDLKRSRLLALEAWRGIK